MDQVEISATSAKNNFGELLDVVRTGQAVRIIRHGRAVAVVLHPEDYERLQGQARLGASEP